MDRSSPLPAGDAVLVAALFASLLLATVVPRAVHEGPILPPLAFERHLVDVNAAPAGEIEALPGIGRVLAGRVVAERAKCGFSSIEQLRRVPGVGPTTLARMRGFVRCGPR